MCTNDGVWSAILDEVNRQRCLCETNEQESDKSNQYIEQEMQVFRIFDQALSKTNDADLEKTKKEFTMEDYNVSEQDFLQFLKNVFDDEANSEGVYSMSSPVHSAPQYLAEDTVVCNKQSLNEDGAPKSVDSDEKFLAFVTGLCDRPTEVFSTPTTASFSISRNSTFKTASEKKISKILLSDD